MQDIQYNVDELVAGIIQQLGKDQAEQFIISINNFVTTTDDIEKLYKANWGGQKNHMAIVVDEYGCIDGIMEQ